MVVTARLESERTERAELALESVCRREKIMC